MGNVHMNTSFFHVGFPSRWHSLQIRNLKTHLWSSVAHLRKTRGSATTEIQAVQLYLIFVTGTTGYLWRKICHAEKFQILIHTSVICVILCTQYILCTVSNFCLILSSVSSSLISSVLSQFTRLCEEENSTYRVVF